MNKRVLIAGISFFLGIRLLAGDGDGSQSRRSPSLMPEDVLLVDDMRPVRFPEDSPPDLTSDGRWLVYGVSDRTKPAERLVYVRDMATGVARVLTDPDSKDGWTAAPRWSPDGQRVALFVKRQGKTRFALWERATDRFSIPIDADAVSGPVDISWRPDGRAVFVVTRAPDPAGGKGSLAKADSGSDRIALWRSPAAVSVDEGRGKLRAPVTTAPLSNDLLWQVTIGPGGALKASRLLRGRGIDSIAASPDGRWVAVTGNSRLAMKEGYGLSSLSDLYVVPLDGIPEKESAPSGKSQLDWTDAAVHALQPRVADIPGAASPGGINCSWAPDSTALAYDTSGFAGDVFMLSVQGPKDRSPARNLTEKVSLPPTASVKSPTPRDFNTRFGFGSEAPFGAPLWNGNAGVLHIGVGDVWLIPRAAGAAPRNLTAADSVHRFTTVLGVLSPAGVYQAAGVGSTVLVDAIDTQTAQEGIWSLRLSDGHLTKIVEQSRLFGGGGWGVRGVNHGDADISLRARKMVTVSEAFNDPPELWEISLDPSVPSARSITSHNSHTPFLQALTQHDLHWDTRIRRLAHGTLLLPENAADPAITGNPKSDPRRPPVMVLGYPGSLLASNFASVFGVNEVGEPFALLRRGYAFYVVDVPLEAFGSYGPNGPMADIVEAVNAGVDTLKATGFVDNSRIAVEGFSDGGTMVNMLLTRSDRFAAGISGAGISDLVSNAGSSDNGMSWYEISGGRMGATLWAQPQRFLQNSPVAYLDRVTAPLLLYHGEKDRHVSIDQSEEMFRGLSYLGRDVTLLRMRNADHGEWLGRDSEVQRDLWSHILVWLDRRFGMYKETTEAGGR